MQVMSKEQFAYYLHLATHYLSITNCPVKFSDLYDHLYVMQKPTDRAEITAVLWQLLADHDLEFNDERKIILSTKSKMVGRPAITHYAAGFAFEGNKLLGLIKNRPNWQAGKYSVPGGHCEEDEESIDTMVREFREETGIITTSSDWTLFAVLHNPEWVVHFYKTEHIDINKYETLTDEQLFIEHIDQFEPGSSLNNMAWLIKMAKSIDTDRANHFDIYER